MAHPLRARLRARFNKLDIPQTDLNKDRKILIGCMLRVKLPQESIKTLSRLISPFVFDLLAILGLCDTLSVTILGGFWTIEHERKVRFGQIW